jgi:hypothetical protein
LHRVGYFIKILFDAWNHECSWWWAIISL